MILPALLLAVGMLLIVDRRRRSLARLVTAPPRLWSARRAELLRRAGSTHPRPGRLIVAQAGAGVLVALVVLVLTGTVSIAACFAVFAMMAPPAFVRRLVRRREAERRGAWPEAVDHLASGVRAGMALPEALAALGPRGPAQLRPAFDRFGSDYRGSGRFAECLDRLQDDLADPVADRICETLRVAREVGGADLGLVLRTLSAFLRDDARTRGELEARQSWTVNAARLAAAAPSLVLLLLATQPATVQAYDSPTGSTLLAVGAIVCLVAYRLMLRIGRLPVELRVPR